MVELWLAVSQEKWFSFRALFKLQVWKCYPDWFDGTDVEPHFDRQPLRIFPPMFGSIGLISCSQEGLKVKSYRILMLICIFCNGWEFQTGSQMCYKVDKYQTVCKT